MGHGAWSFKCGFGARISIQSADKLAPYHVDINIPLKFKGLEQPSRDYETYKVNFSCS